MPKQHAQVISFASSSPAAKRAILKDIPWSGPNSAGCGGVSIGDFLLHWLRVSLSYCKSFAALRFKPLPAAVATTSSHTASRVAASLTQ